LWKKQASWVSFIASSDKHIGLEWKQSVQLHLAAAYDLIRLIKEVQGPIHPDAKGRDIFLGRRTLLGRLEQPDVRSVKLGRQSTLFCEHVAGPGGLLQVIDGDRFALRIDAFEKLFSVSVSFSGRP
jgi:hypothetical protein